MSENLTTKEVAAYLRLNEKKVYALVAAGKLPAARISGKWLFPKKLIDQWVAGNTVYPASGLMGALLDKMLVIQGSDDMLLSQTIEAFQNEREVPVPQSTIGSVPGLRALSAGLAHLAGCHVSNEQVAQVMDLAEGCYLVSLFERQQGLFFHPQRVEHLESLTDLKGSGLRFAGRQPGSGTHRLTEKLFAEAGLAGDSLDQRGPYPSHLEVGLAIVDGEADLGLGIQLAAERCGLGFLSLHREQYKLAIPVAFAGHPQIAGFMDYVLGHCRTLAKRGIAGYGFDSLGQLEVITPDWQPSRSEKTGPSAPAWTGK